MNFHPRPHRIPRALLVALAGVAAVHLRAADPIKLELKVPMRDGIHLATDVWLPNTNGTFPVIFLRFPYNKDLGVGLGRDGVARGYAVVAQDTRGRFKSEGQNLPFHLEKPDGEDSVAWVRRQPWCNGKIGTFGGSAGAITQFQMVSGGSGPVTAQHLTVGAPDVYEVAYTGGVLRKSLVEDWIKATKFAPGALETWVSHPTHDAFWRAQDATRNYGSIHCPALHIAGYWDIFAQSSIEAFNGYQLRGGSGARGRQKLLIGPWSHGVLQEKVGDLTFPGGKAPPRRVHDQWLWFDHTLKGLTNGVEDWPAVTYYVVGDTSDPQAPGNVWRTADAWPPVKTSATPYYLQADRRLTPEAPRPSPTLPAALAYAYDPRNPVPTVGGIQLTLPAGPREQKAVESRDDVLVFTTDALATPVEVTGRVLAKLWVSSDAPDTDFVVRLCDVYPDGRSFNLCEGFLRARHRDGVDREHLLKPGRTYPITVDCWSTSVIFNRGHRIRVQVTSSCAPGFDPNPNTGERLRSSDRAQVAHNTVHLDRAHPSHVVLPVVPR